MYMMVFLLVLLFIWLMFRIVQYRKRTAEIDERARKISTMNAPTKVKKGRPSLDRKVMEAPSVGLLVIMHKNGQTPAREMFVNALSKGRKGILVTPEDPREVPIDSDIKRIWLNRSIVKRKGEDVTIVNPTNLSGLLEEVNSFITAGDGSTVVLLDQFQDLMNANDLPRVIKFLSMLRERSAKDRVSILVPLPYKTIPQRIRNQIMESFETVVV